MEFQELLYEAAFVPELWTPALDRLANASGSIGSTIFVFGESGRARGATLDNLTDLLASFVASDTLRFSTSVVRMCETKPNSFVEVDAFMTAEEIAQDPIRIQLRARGIGAHVCTAIPMPGGELVIYVLQKPLDAGRYDDDEIARLDSVRPDLARAGLIAARLGLERARGMVGALEGLGLAAAVCAGNRVLATNALFLVESERFPIGRDDRITLSGSAANELLQATLQAGHSSRGPQVRSIPMPATQERPPGVLHALPLRRSARDLFGGGDTILVFTTVNATEVVPSPSILSGLFDLTPAEARIAVSLASGNALKSAAEAGDIKFSTARSHLEQIFRKTGTNQQSQLVALLKSASVVR